MPETIDVETGVIKVIAGKLNIDEEDVTPGSSLIDDLKADPVDTLEIFLDLGQKFGIKIPPKDAATLQTIRDIINHIEGKTS